MYNFVKPDEETQTQQLLSVAMNFNGGFIEQQVTGYQTLNVSGREMVGVDIDMESVHTGSIILSERIPHRELEIEFSLRGDDNNQFQKRFQQLMKILHAGEVEVYFNDEPELVYYVRLADVSDIPAHTNHVVGTFTLVSETPYKFGPLVTSSGGVTIETPYPTPPAKITLTVASTSTQLSVTNGDKEIRMNGNFNAGSVIEIDVEAGTLKHDGVDVPHILAINSDFENFTVQQGQTVSSPDGTVELVCRERWL